MNRLLFLIATTFLAAPLAAQDVAAQAKANEQRLRDGLRSVTAQLRAAESEKASLLAAQTERDQRIASLGASLATLSKETADARAASEAAAAALKAASDRDRTEIASLRSSLAKWKKATEEATAAYHRSEALRVKLDAANASLERRAEARERQNLALFKTGSEILQRYENFSLGRALTAREPFTGIARARLESQIQDYKDLLDDQKLKPAPAAGPKPAPAPSSPAPAKP